MDFYQAENNGLKNKINIIEKELENIKKSKIATEKNIKDIDHFNQKNKNKRKIDCIEEVENNKNDKKITTNIINVHKLKNINFSYQCNNSIYNIQEEINEKTKTIINEFLVKINDALNNPSMYKKLKKCLERCEKNWSNGGFVCTSIQKKNNNNNEKKSVYLQSPSSGKLYKLLKIIKIRCDDYDISIIKNKLILTSNVRINGTRTSRSKICITI